MAFRAIGKKISGAFKNVIRAIPLFVMAFLSFYILLLSFLSAFEIVFNKDVNYVYSLERSGTGTLINNILKQNNNPEIRFSTNAFAKNRKMIFLNIPSLNRRLELSKAFYSKDIWYQKGNKANYFLTGSVSGDDYLYIYLKESWRTIQNIQSLRSGELAFLITEDNWNYVFRINEVRNIGSKETYIPSSSKDLSIIFIVEKEDLSGFTVFEASLINATSE